MLERITRLDGALSSQRNGMFRVDSTRPGRSDSLVEPVPASMALLTKPGITWPG